MSNVKEVVDALYSSYLARDFFAKVLPGSVVLGSAIMWTEPPIIPASTLENLPVLGWLLVYGLCWAVGFAVQAAGEFTGIVRAYPGDETEDDLHARIAQFNNSNPGAADKSQQERFVVIKEASGNLGVATILATVFVAVCAVLPDYRKWIGATFLFLGVIAWLWFQTVHQRRQRKWELRVIAKSKRDEGKSV